MVSRNMNLKLNSPRPTWQDLQSVLTARVAALTKQQAWRTKRRRLANSCGACVSKSDDASWGLIIRHRCSKNNCAPTQARTNSRTHAHTYTHTHTDRDRAITTLVPELPVPRHCKTPKDVRKPLQLQNRSCQSGLFGFLPWYRLLFASTPKLKS